MNHIPKRQVGQHIAIVGASTGIGRAVAVRLAAEGAKVSVFSRRRDLLEETAAMARGAGAADVRAFDCDVRERGHVDAAIEAACSELGLLRGAIAVAGIGGPNAPGPDDRFDEIVRVNLTGTYNVLRAAERRLVSDGTRHLVAFSSILGRFGVPGYTGYCASKSGILGLVRALAMELAPNEVQVNALCPGWVETDMAWEGIDGIAAAIGVSREEALRRSMRHVPLGRMSTPDDVAGVVAWLLSPDARGVTGQGIDINNGAWMG